MSRYSRHCISVNIYTNAEEQGVETAFRPDLKYGMQLAAFAEITATLSDGVTKNCFPKTIFLSIKKQYKYNKSGNV